MKKKIVSMLLIVCLLVVGASLTSCQSANTLLTKAFEKTDALTEYAAEMKMEMSMEIAGEKIDVPVVIDMKVKDAKSENPVLWAEYSATTAGQETTMEMYKEGEWIYLASEALGGGFKISAEESEGEYDFAKDVDEIVAEIPEELLEDAEVVKNDDGSKSVSVVIPKEKFSEIYGDLLKTVTEMNGGDEDAKASASDITVKVTVDDGYISSYDISFKLSMTLFGQTVESDVTASVTFKNLGEEVTITPPEGYADFKEM